MPLRIFFAGLLLLSALSLGLVGYRAVQPPETVRIFSAPTAPVPALTVDVLVAARSLPAGTLIKDEDFAQRAALAAEIPQGALTNTPEIRAGLRGALLRRYLDPGSVVMAGDLLHPRDRGFLAAALTPGARAISIGVDAITGDGGLIWPGDRVDLILTQELAEKDAPLARRLVGETVMSDVRVVAVDQSITQGAIAAGDNATGRLARTVTLEVTPHQAERAVVAVHLGKVTLAIRAADGVPDETGQRASVYGGDVSAALADGGTPVVPRMRVVDGKDAREVTFEWLPETSRAATPSRGSANVGKQP
jgi:pilus assembly protein CpaB